MPGSRLEGKRAVVTGAGSGIGRASARLFAQEGAAVLVSDVAEDGLAETIEQIEKAGGRARGVVADVSEEAAVAGLVETCVREFGGLEVVYANAGIVGQPVALFDTTVEDWRRVLDVNLIGPFLAIKYASKVMREAGGGSILCTASVAGLRSGAGPTAYSASKAGVVSLVQTAANQLVGTGVRVNAICPGLIETGMTRPMFEMARAAGKTHKIGQLNPLRRAGEPAEIANMALFLASDEASYVNGQAIAVDGGLSSSHPFVPGRLA
ncbi:MAG: SDR family oxidoreductase [Deltaproteobacteria bacterium]|nr:SDR family oxidoreductase [Deltaproteobacteria bacterium]MBW2444592.1 SDR family oxidoreductase [Deltaproteobacteria bacterium]